MKNCAELIGVGVLVLCICLGIGGCSYLLDKGRAEVMKARKEMELK